MPLQSQKDTSFPRAAHSTKITHRSSTYVESAAIFCFYLVFFNIKLKIELKDTTPHKTDLIQAAPHLCIHHSQGYLLLEHISLQNIRKPQGTIPVYTKGEHTSTWISDHKIMHSNCEIGLIRRVTLQYNLTISNDGQNWLNKREKCFTHPKQLFQPE